MKASVVMKAFMMKGCVIENIRDAEGIHDDKDIHGDKGICGWL